MKPYKTADKPGGKTVSPEEAESTQARAPKRLPNKRPPDQPEDSAQSSPSRRLRPRTQQTTAKEVSLSATELHLSCKLAHSVYLGRWVPAICLTCSCCPTSSRVSVHYHMCATT